MGKTNDQIEEILDNVDDHEKRLQPLEKAIPQILELLKELKGGGKSPPQTVQPATKVVKPDYSDMKDAVYDGMQAYFLAFPQVAGGLDEASIKKISEICSEQYAAEWSEYYEKNNVERKAKEDDYKQKLDILQIRTAKQVAEWAPEYTPEVQRILGYLGRKVLYEDEPVENAHKILKVFGDLLSGITKEPDAPPPTLKSWWLYRWSKFKKSTDKWGFFKWYLLLMGIVVAVVCNNIYQERLMDLDRTNRLFYRHVMKTEQGRKEYHELDSLIHNNSFFKTYRTLDE